ncbi:MAG: phycobilisome protein [Cyanobacteriota bacterium]|jgi:hypothetical protein
MQKDFERLFHRAEDHYLHPLEMISFKKHLALMSQRLEAYRMLRDKEGEIFQTAADQLEAQFPDRTQADLEQALLHWISVLRYGAMAMLLSNPEYLQYRLLEWLEGMVEARELRPVESRLAQLLTAELQKTLTEDGFKLLQPFLAQAEKTILGAVEEPQPATVGEPA